MTDPPLGPAIARFDEQFVFFGTVSADLAKRHAESIGANPCSLRQHRHQVALPKREAAEARNRRLLAQEFANHGGVFSHAVAPMEPAAGEGRTWKPRGNGAIAVPLATMPETSSSPRIRSEAL